MLDEMYAPTLAQELQRRGHDVIALVTELTWRSLSDAEVYALATSLGRRVVAENVKDFRPLVAAGEGPGVLLASSRAFARSRRNPGPLIEALDRWLQVAGSERPVEDWLLIPD